MLAKENFSDIPRPKWGNFGAFGFIAIFFMLCRVLNLLKKFGLGVTKPLANLCFC
jgi:hypothetical protein